MSNNDLLKVLEGKTLEEQLAYAQGKWLAEIKNGTQYDALYWEGFVDGLKSKIRKIANEDKTVCYTVCSSLSPTSSLRAYYKQHFGWVYGSFTKKENAEKLLKALSELGVKAKIEERIVEK